MQRWQASKAHLPFLTLQIQENKPKEKKQLKEEKKKKKTYFYVWALFTWELLCDFTVLRH